MCRLADRVDFLRLRAIGGFDRSRVWQTEGVLSAASAVRARARMTRGQGRRAEALVSMCRRYLAGRDDGAGPRRGRTHVSLVADIGASIGISDDLLAAARAEAAHVGMLSRVTLERILCDCKVSRILTDGP